MRSLILALSIVTPLILFIPIQSDLASSRLMLETPTYDGSGQAVHPDVFHSSWGWPKAAKYRYWMVLTPYAYSDFSRENPSILVSNNGRNWFVPEGLVNPIEPAPTEGHYSDPDIVMGDGRLWVFFRWDKGLEERIYAKSSNDGIH